MDSVARHVLVSGRVQGVGFRWSACDRAERCGVAGWVRNLEDGRVEAWVQGPAGAVDAMLAWLAEGPSPARVSGVESRPAEPRDYTGFRARRTAAGRAANG
jgi:acylphosphatase